MNRAEIIRVKISLSNMNASDYFPSAIVTTVIGMDWIIICDMSNNGPLASGSSSVQVSILPSQVIDSTEGVSIVVDSQLLSSLHLPLLLANRLAYHYSAR